MNHIKPLSRVYMKRISIRQWRVYWWNATKFKYEFHNRYTYEHEARRARDWLASQPL